jgi:sulfane dehydrogenase subunit SoxC
VDRRRFLGRGLALGAAVVPARARAQASAPDDPSRILGGPKRAYGGRSRFETAERRGRGKTDEHGGNLAPLADLVGIITPSELHFTVFRGGVPDIDPHKHRLLIHGMVERPVLLTMADLKRLPSVSRIYFIECSGNTQTEWRGPTAPTVQGTHGNTSCAEWTGVPLAALLREVGVRRGASWVIAEGADATGNERSIPLGKAMSDILVAYGQNGEAIRPENGYPLRLVVPGWEGNVNVKWLRRLTLTDRPYMSRMETVEHASLMPDGKARRFQFVMEAKSVITFPSGGQRLAAPGFYEITGLAWTGRGRIRRVDVSTDGGATWRRAALEEPVLPLAHVRFRLPWRWDSREAVLQSRCVDETGYVQPTLRELVRVRGVNSVFHLNAIQSWKVAADGSVSNVHVEA